MKTLTACLLLCSLSWLSAQTYPLSENTWSNSDFVKRFMGSYGVDTEKAPSISRDESKVFSEVAKIAGEDIESAIRLLREAINNDSSAAVDFALANFLLQQQNFAGAESAYQAAIKKFPNFGRAYKNLGLAYLQQADYAAALPHLTKALEILGGDGGLFGLIAYCHLNQGNNGPALDAYKFALVYEPNSRDWRLGQLKALQNLGRYNEVEGLIYSYIKDEPEEPEFWLQQANAFIAQGKYAEAAANLEIVDLLNAADPEIRLLLGDLYVNLDAAALALKPYEQALDSGQVPTERVLKLAETMSRRLTASELKKLLDRIESNYAKQLTGSDQLTFLTLQAANALDRGEKTSAMQLLGQVVAKDPLNGSALLTLGSYYYGEAQYLKALDYYSRAEKVKTVKVDALLGSARVLVKQNKYPEAIRRLKEAQTLNDQAFIAQYINTLQGFVE